MKILNAFFAPIMTQEKKPLVFSVAGLAASFCVLGFFNRELAAGLLFLLLLISITLFCMAKAGIQDRKIYVAVLLALMVHLGAVVFIYYGEFKPFGGGADYDGYNQIAIELASRFGHGNFSLGGLYTDHFFPILMGVVYLLVWPGMIVGQLFTVWLAVITILLLYLLVLEVGGTRNIAFAVTLCVIFYPSYMYFGSLLLKDTIVIPLALLCMLLAVKMSKHFSLYQLLLFFVALTGLVNLRFYVAYAVLFSFLLTWPLLSPIPLKKRAFYWLVMAVVLGFSPQLVGNGYYGSGSFQTLFNIHSITHFREIVYATPSPLNTPAPSDGGSAPEPDLGSTFVVETGFKQGALVFLKNSTQSFIYSLLGPFPWQFTQKRQIVGLAESLPWYVLILVGVYGRVQFIRKNGFKRFLQFHKYTLPLLVFGVLAIGALSLFINNYGIIARIRIPMFMVFLCAMFISFNENEKISNYWRRWVYRKPSVNSAVGTGE